MGKIRALLTGVSEYDIKSCTNLPYCRNDLYAMRHALIKGLNVKSEDIIVCGEGGTVRIEDLNSALSSALYGLTEDDIFIFYFTGHGSGDSLILSDSRILFQNIIDEIGKVPVRSKIMILDTCHSGNFTLESVPSLDMDKAIEDFVGRGFAVMASCSPDQFSGFNVEREMSAYTSFVCDAMTARFLIRKGRKSLEDINQAVFRFSEVYNRKQQNAGYPYIQEPIFRSSIGGTLFFDVEEYSPYKVENIYEETEDYIIYKVEPVNTMNLKRLSAEIILKYQFDLEKIADITLEIRERLKYEEIFQNGKAEAMLKGKRLGILFCYFGYDEDDMIDHNYYCRTTWLDYRQDKKKWYHKNENAVVINDVYLVTNPSYDEIKQLKDHSIDKDRFISITRDYAAHLVTAAEKYIKAFREYLNNTITEESFINIIRPLNDEIEEFYFKQNDLPIAPNELHEWSNKHSALAGDIYDFTLFYNENSMETRTEENRRWLMNDAIKRYHRELEELKEIDKDIDK